GVQPPGRGSRGFGSVGGGGGAGTLEPGGQAGAGGTGSSRKDQWRHFELMVAGPETPRGLDSIGVEPFGCVAADQGDDVAESFHLLVEVPGEVDAGLAALVGVAGGGGHLDGDAEVADAVGGQAAADGLG